ncbi:MAG TPA: ABC transporter ATP-binding protein [Ktedonobacterales bacterium]|nr:ABC transporter ATP-binding protein [Ktedonobacterales bacterium]
MSLNESPARAARPAAQSEPGAAIVVEHLTKTYGDKTAVNDLSFSVRPGEIFALLGPNGAGKTTTVEILEGYRTPTSGSARTLGLDPRRDAAALKPQLGVMLQQDGLYPGLRASEVLNLYASFFARPEAPDALLERVGLRDAAGTRCRQLSGGQKRRLALAVALVGRPRLLFLDEPTTGMDPQARRATWEIIRAAAASGATVLLTTHFMDEAERLADRIAIMDNGALVALDTPTALTGGNGAPDVRFKANAGLDVAHIAALPAARAAHETAPGAYVVETADAPALAAELTAWLRDSSGGLTELRVGAETLEDVFLRLTGKEMRE